MPGAFLHDERVRDAVALAALTPTADGMPVANSRNPQPRRRARFTGGAASVLGPDLYALISGTRRRRGPTAAAADCHPGTS